MFVPALVAVLLFNSGDTNSSTFASKPPTVTITDINLNDRGLTQSPIDSSLQPASKRPQTPVEVHIQPIDPATEIQSKVLEFSE